MGIESRGQLAPTSREHTIAMIVVAGLKPFLEEMDQKIEMVLAKLDAILAWQREVEARTAKTPHRNEPV
jgi:hypothetical protein